jgi:hypothetical protein
VTRRECDLKEEHNETKLSNLEEKIANVTSSVDKMSNKVDWTLKLLVVVAIGVYFGRTIDTGILPMLGVMAVSVADPLYSVGTTFLYIINT